MSANPQPNAQAITSIILWHRPADEMPDDELTVFLTVVYKTTGMRDVVNGFRCAGVWHFDDGVTVERVAEVLLWADWPEVPEV